MRPRTFNLLWWGCVCMVMSPVNVPIVLAETPTETFNSLYGPALERVKATRDRGDDVELAKNLVKAARESRKLPEFGVVLCQHAYELTRSHAPTIALDAMRLLAELSPKEPGKTTEKIIALLTLSLRTGSAEEKTAAGDELVGLFIEQGDAAFQANDSKTAASLYRRGLVIASQRRHKSADELKAKINSALSRQRIVSRAERLERTLLKDATSQATLRDLALTYLLELDQPEKVGRLIDRIKDKALQAHLRLAMSGQTLLTAEIAYPLGEWYASLAKSETGTSAIAARAKAVQCFQRFLLLYSNDDIKRKKAELFVKQFAELLKPKAVESTPGEGRIVRKGKTIDLLKLIDTSKDGVSGRWFKTDGTLSSDQAHQKFLALPIRIEGGYRLRVILARQVNGGELRFRLPVGKVNADLFIDAWRSSGGRSGLGSVDGNNTSNNATTIKGFHIRNGTKHEIVATVQSGKGKVSVSATFDGKSLVNWVGEESQLSYPASPDLKNQPYLGMQGTPFTFYEVEITSLDGKAAFLRPNAK